MAKYITIIASVLLLSVSSATHAKNTPISKTAFIASLEQNIKEATYGVTGVQALEKQKSVIIRFIGKYDLDTQLTPEEIKDIAKYIRAAYPDAVSVILSEGANDNVLKSSGQLDKKDKQLAIERLKVQDPTETFEERIL